MKKNLGVKLQLLGIALIIFSFYSLSYGSGPHGFWNGLIVHSVYLSKFAGLILCIAGLFHKEKDEKKQNDTDNQEDDKL